jgi:hypothetical protein
MTRTLRVLTRARIANRRAGIVFVAACAALLVLGMPAVAGAVSTRDLIELSRAGLGDEVLVALIEADGTVFNLDAPKILELRAAGVSERVITAMIRNGAPAATTAARAATDVPATAPPPLLPSTPPEQDGAPYFVVIGEREPTPPPAPTPTYFLPWIPAWSGAQGRPARAPQPTTGYRGFGRFINDGWVDHSRR